MKKYTYKFVKTEADPDPGKSMAQQEQDWNDLGSQGWRFCAFTGGFTVFIREVIW